MIHIFYFVYFSFLGSFGGYLVKEFMNEFYKKKVRFNNLVETILIERVENKEDYWYNLEDFNSFYIDYINS